MLTETTTPSGDESVPDGAGASEPAQPPAPPRRPRRPFPRWVNVVCFLATVWTTLVAGTLMTLGDLDPQTIKEILVTPRFWSLGLPYAVAVILILGTHEMGHYVACRLYRIDASLPFFLPAPQLFGTFGAVIRIRAPITDKRALFDIGVAGPIAGFVMAIPVLAYGMSHSTVLPGPAETGGFTLPPCLLLVLAERLKTGGAEAVILTHPTLNAAWLGLLATGLNLLPIGQLDGGHVLYSLSPRVHGVVSRAGIPILIAAGLYFGGYYLVVFGLLFAFIGRRHPPVLDDRLRLGPGRMALAVVALLIFVATFMVHGFV